MNTVLSKMFTCLFVIAIGIVFLLLDIKQSGKDIIGVVIIAAGVLTLLWEIRRYENSMKIAPGLIRKAFEKHLESLGSLSFEKLSFLILPVRGLYGHTHLVSYENRADSWSIQPLRISNGTLYYYIRSPKGERHYYTWREP